MMNYLSAFSTQDYAIFALAFSMLCFGVAVLLHVRKEANLAHGKFRK